MASAPDKPTASAAKHEIQRDHDYSSSAELVNELVEIETKKDSCTSDVARALESDEIKQETITAVIPYVPDMMCEATSGVPYVIKDQLSFLTTVDHADLAITLDCNDLFNRIAPQMDYPIYLQTNQRVVYNLVRVIKTVIFGMNSILNTSSPDISEHTAAYLGFCSQVKYLCERNELDKKRLAIYNKWNICKTVYPYIVLTNATCVQVGNLFDRYQKKYTTEEWGVYPLRTFVSFYFDHLVKLAKSDQHIRTNTTISNQFGFETEGLIALGGGNHRMQAFREIIRNEAMTLSENY